MVAVQVPNPDLERYCSVLNGLVPWRFEGRVTRVVGLVVEATGLCCPIGELCHLTSEFCAQSIPAEVVGFKDRSLLLMPLAPMEGLRPGTRVVSRHRSLQVGVGPELLGRVLDGLGIPIDGPDPCPTRRRYPLEQSAPHPLHRPRIVHPVATGIRAIDGLLTCGQGQRVGIFAGSGIGKSTLLGMIARYTDADVNVFALIGERGREVREFIESDLGPEGLRRSVVVVVTSDQPALLRIKGGLTATAIAEFFRDQGAQVNLFMDSITRLAMAQREIGLSLGEPPATRGYPPSVYALLPKLLERAGTSDRGAITGFYTVLMEGDDTSEPIADALRSLLDGHIVLSRRLAQEGHFPAIDILQSISRLMPQLISVPHFGAAGALRELLATYEEARPLLEIGAYLPGTNPLIDAARGAIPAIRNFLRQPIGERAEMARTVAQLQTLAAHAIGLAEDRPSGQEQR